jgi:vanillate O-demethylase ferredoxin subunit
MSLVARVVSKVAEAIDIVAIGLEPAEGGLFPEFTAGAHIDVDLGMGIVRQYSLCSSPAERSRYLIAVKREPESRGGSQAIHDRLQCGDNVDISTPRNHFPLAADATRHLFFAGGIGITPFMAMIEALDGPGAPFHLHYFTRSTEHAAFHERLSRDGVKDSVFCHVGVEPPQLRVFLRRTLWKYVPGTHLYVCGPGPFIDAVLSAASAWPQGTVHREYFANPQSAAARPLDACTIRLAKSGKTVEVAEGQSVLAALNLAGCKVPSSCEQGVCGTCVVGLVDGDADHRDAYLTPEERSAGRLFVPCVSRPTADALTLDL